MEEGESMSRRRKPRSKAWVKVLSLCAVVVVVVWVLNYSVFGAGSKGISILKGETSQDVEEIYFENETVKLSPGKKAFYKPVILPESKDYKLVWTSSQPSHVKVSDNGEIMALKAGVGKTVAITATIKNEDGKGTSNMEASYGVTVLSPVSKIKITAARDYVMVGKKRVLKAACYPAAAANKTVKWVSKQPEYAAISQNGVIVPKKEGAGKSVRFEAIATDGSKVKQSYSIKIIDPDKPMIALTFDDGPSAVQTKRLLDILEKNNTHATFFVLGSNLEGSGRKDSRDVLKKVHEAGNEIASHTFAHKQLPKLSVSQINYEIDKTSELIKSAIGVEPTSIRPPYGALSDTVRQVAKQPFIMWSIDTLDWKTRDKNATTRAVVDHAKDGDIVLMHDIHKETVDAVEIMIPQLIEKGYQLVTVQELAELKNVKMEPGKSYSQFR